MRALRFVPPLVWTALVMWASTDTWSADQTGSVLVPLLAHLIPWASADQIDTIHWFIRKTAHVLEYGVLGAFWSLAFARRHGRRRWLLPLAFSILTAIVDELQQSTTMARTASPADVLLDSSAAGAA